MSARFEDLTRICDKALKTDLEEFVQLCERVGMLLSEERQLAENAYIKGRLVEVQPRGEATVIGDLHGDLATLKQILGDSNFVEKSRRGDKSLLIFLGDYGDRGLYSPEVYYVVLRLKENHPGNVVLMRGNHEGPKDLLAYPHDLPIQLQSRFGEGWSTAYAKLRELFTHMHNALIVDRKYIMLHGGVPTQAESVEEVAYAHEMHPTFSHLEEILWSDPQEGLTGTCPSPRGAGKLFGSDVTDRFLQMLNVKVLIRGHEPSEKGFKINQEGRILTLFSRRGEPYHNRHAAYLQLDLAGEIDDAHGLKRFVRVL